MTSLMQQWQMSYDAVNTTAESLERAEQQKDPVQLQQQMERDLLQMHQQQKHQQRDHDLLQLQQQQQQRDREQLQVHQREREELLRREKLQLHHRDHLAQLQSINNLLLDMPSASKASGSNSGRDYELPARGSQTRKGSTDGDGTIYDLLGLLPGSLTDSQSSANSSSSYWTQHHGQSHGHSSPQHHGQSYGHSSPHVNYPQHDEGYGYHGNSWNMDMPGTPNSVTTPGSPSTPGSVYSNPYTHSTGGNSSGCVTPSPTNRSYHNHGSPSSQGYSSYYGRPIRGSSAYSDCSSPTVEYPPVFGFSGSRSNSPADSETSGYYSVDGSMSDCIGRNCLSMNSSGHSCYPQSANAFMNADLENYYERNRASAYQRMAVKKIQQQQQQQHSNMRHHCYYTPSKKVLPINKSPPALTESHMSLERAAKFHRNAAALCEATCTWVGELPKRTPKASGFSSKVFLGGVPYDVTESLLISTFKQFGQIRVEWPGKEDSQPKGYAYIIFESEKQVKALLSCCTHHFGDEKSWYYRITPKRSKPKDVQVIPWYISNSNYSKTSSQKLDPEKTVFVGALHGTLTAEGLAKIMNDLFDEVIYTGIDTDKFKYPIGSARVTFSNKRSYKKACLTGFVELKTDKFTKKIQIDPYIEDSVCSGCGIQHGPYFCREPICSRYFCRSCWFWQHAWEPMSHHMPMSRGGKSKQIVPFGFKFSKDG